MSHATPIPLAVFLLVFTRWAAIAVLVPGQSLLPIPIRFRLVSALLAALLLAPLQVESLSAAPSSLELAWLAGHELLIGLAIATAILLLIQGLQLAGHLISRLSGASLVGLLGADGGERQPPQSRLIVFCILGTALSLGAHREILDVALTSYQQAPLGTSLAGTTLLATITQLFSLSFLIALRISLPVVTVLLLGLLAAGWISRIVPQLNMIVLGWNSTAILGLVLVLLGLGGMSWVFQEQLAEAMRYVGQLWQPTAGV